MKNMLYECNLFEKYLQNLIVFYIKTIQQAQLVISLLLLLFLI